MYIKINIYSLNKSVRECFFLFISEMFRIFSLEQNLDDSLKMDFGNCKSLYQRKISFTNLKVAE